MRSLKWLAPISSQTKSKLRFIDQTRLPLEETYIETDSCEVVAKAIRKMSIRGAPALGVAAAYGVALAAFQYSGKEKEDFLNSVLGAIKLLKSTRPTAVNLFWSLERMMAVLNSNIEYGIDFAIKKIEEEAIIIHEEDIRMCDSIGKNGATLINDSTTILTHCNTGALATGGDGTAQNVIVTAHRQGKKIKVYADETRPLLQGARLTMWELTNLGIDATLITDSTATFLMQQKKIDVVITGADRITLSGYIANKIGTYNIAVAAKFHKIPFFVAAPTSTIDLNLKIGSEIIIEERNPSEVTETLGRRIAPYNVKVFSPAFDITPPELVSAIITEKEILYPPYETSIQQMFASK
jgi:methylthioribose-1-phosphate isomerase